MPRPEGEKKPNTLEPQEPARPDVGLPKPAMGKPKPRPAAAPKPVTKNVTLESFLAGLRRHESGGNYRAKNPSSTASGAYQYLDSTWNNYGGYRHAKDAPPEVQDRRAREDVQRALQRYNGDWEKVAAAHFAGAGWVAKHPDKRTWGQNPAPGSTNPNVSSYVSSVLRNAGLPTAIESGGQTRYPSGGVASAPPTSPAVGGFGPDQKPDTAAAIASYGYVAELAATVPAVKAVLSQAISGGWTPERFGAEIRKTDWWRKTTETSRQIDVLKATNPADYSRRLQQMADTIVIRTRQLGLPQDNAKIKTMAEKALRQGWTAAELDRYVAADVKAGTTNKGLTAVTVDSLKAQAKAFLVPISDATLQTWTKQILQGDVPVEAFQSYLKEQAASLFPSMRGALDSGVTVSQYVEPYRELAAQTLELNPDQVDFMKPKWAQALFQIGKDGQRTSMSLADWAVYLRKQPEYGKTRAANEQAAGFTSSLLEIFGKVS